MSEEKKIKALEDAELDSVSGGGTANIPIFGEPTAYVVTSPTGARVYTDLEEKSYPYTIPYGTRFEVSSPRSIRYKNTHYYQILAQGEIPGGYIKTSSVSPVVS